MVAVLGYPPSSTRPPARAQEVCRYLLCCGGGRYYLHIYTYLHNAYLHLQGVGGGPGALAEGDAGAGGGRGVAAAAHQPGLGVGEPGNINTSKYLHM